MPSVMRGMGGKASYHLMIKPQFLVDPSPWAETFRRTSRPFSLPYVRQENETELELATGPAPRSDEALVS